MEPWTLADFLEDTQDHPLFVEELGLRVVGSPQGSRLVLVLGPNGAGKSLLRKWVSQTTHDQKMESIPLSMSGRKGQYMASLVYGDEGSNSTGDCSTQTLQTAFRTCQGRSTPHVLFLDEPDVGAGPELSMGMGAYLASELPKLGPCTEAVFLVSHSRELLASLVPLQPCVIFVGCAHESLEEWLSRKIEPVSLEEFHKGCWDLHKRVQKHLKPKPA